MYPTEHQLTHLKETNHSKSVTVTKLSYLNAAVFPGEEDNHWQTAYDDAGQDENRGAHHPVQGHDTGTVILAGFAALRALQALKHPRLAVLVVH
jgi:hypothetical protein